jgi:hypothetical protein
LPELVAAAVSPDHPDDGNVGGELAQISRDVGRAPRIKRFARNFYHGNRCFRRDAPNPAPNELVEHQIANDEEPPLTGAVKNLLQSF